MVSSSSNRSDKGVSIGVYLGQGDGLPRSIQRLVDPNCPEEEIYLVLVQRDQLHTIVVENLREGMVFATVERPDGILPDINPVKSGQRRIFNKIPVGVKSAYDTAVYTVTVTEDVLLLKDFQGGIPSVQVTNLIRRATFIVRTASSELFHQHGIRFESELVVIAC